MKNILIHHPTGLKYVSNITNICMIMLAGLIITARMSGGEGVCSLHDFKEVIIDIGNHDSFNYLNQGVLSDQFFNDASASMDDEAVYLILSSTKTASSRVISLFTENDFNHISLSFDCRLKTLVSYNGGNSRYSPGMNPELVGDLVKENDSHAIVYRLKLKKDQKLEILNNVKRINSEGSSYNLLGLVLKRSIKPNIMYCSQFLYSLLSEAGVQYFSVKNKIIKPSDFIELDYLRELEFCYELGDLLL